ncbi:MAG: DUF3825 domain-containing protein [Acidobacteria bacterium]|nr:DUF3825 domain-containing protein [Acidobacteriota bacterium]
MQKRYQSLFRRYVGQVSSEIFAHFPYDRLAGETWEAPLAALARLAKLEDWNFARPEFKKPASNFPILSGYLNYTFLRLQQESKIRFTQDQRQACFNTGLQTPDENNIFAVFARNTRSDPEQVLRLVP